MMIASLVTAALLSTILPARYQNAVWAQLGAPPVPLSPPPPPPGAVISPLPAVPAGIPSIGALPPLSAVAGLLTPSPTPTPGGYSCSCYGSAGRTRWVGNVQAAGPFQARQDAVNQCLAYLFDRKPASAFVPPPVFNFFPTPAPPIAASEAEPGLPNLSAPGLSGFALLNSAQGANLGSCEYCVCN
ncbi:MAG TPA: hypothetical protein VKV28_12405 [Candidatus Binataceae bacterium]|nr:hypothetical protein [Candidatus Binataceae bacterium]